MNYSPYSQTVVFLDSVKNPVTAPATSKSVENSCCDSLNLEVQGTFTAIDMSVEGCICTRDANGDLLKDADCSWTQIAAISMKDFTNVEKIIAKGIYCFGISGMNKVRVKVNSISGGNAKIVGGLTK